MSSKPCYRLLMLSVVAGLLTAIPEVALLASLAIGYSLGQVRFGQTQLGGVCGTLIVALAIGQFGVVLDVYVKTVFFALFIFAPALAGGLQFFSNLKARGMRLSAFCLACSSCSAWCWRRLTSSSSTRARQRA